MFHFPPFDIFGELVILLLVAAALGALMLRLRQPLVIAFILVGLLAGPAGFSWIRSTDAIHVFAQIGLALLLFVVGLRLDLYLIRTMGATLLVAGLGQVVATSLVAFVLSVVLGLPLLTAVYVAIALTFSSTVIIVKLLSDSHEIDSLHGRITLGVLIVQDLVVVLALFVISSTGATTVSPTLSILFVLLKITGLLVSVWFVTFFVLPRLLGLLARSTELLVLFAIAWALLLTYLGEVLGIGQEVGAFLAGVSLASTTYREIIGVKLVSLRDFLLLFFFVELGSRLDLQAIGASVGISIALIVFVLLGKPLLMLGVLSLMGYRKRTGFMTGISLAQISEFSLIFIAAGAAAGHIGDATVGSVTLIGLVTIGISSYLMQYAVPLYDRLSPYLRVFERKTARREDVGVPESLQPGGIILFGLGPYGTGMAAELLARDRDILGVDFDPHRVREWQRRGWPAVFGDAEDPDFIATLPLSRARWVVSAMRDPNINTALAQALQHTGYTGHMAFTARSRDEGLDLLRRHIGLLFVPLEDAAVQAVDLLFNREAVVAREEMDHYIEQLTGHYIVCGYGRMGQQIVKDFQRAGVPFVVVEDNPEQLQRLKTRGLPHVVGKAAQDDVLSEAGIQRAKGLIAVTASDEENVFIVLTARGMNPKLYIVARSIREENENKLLRAGANRVMSPYILGGRRMAAAVTRPGVMDFLDLVIHSDNLKIEIRGITVPADAAYANRSLAELGLWQQCGVTVLAIQRPREELHANPCPDDVVRAGDELIVMGTPEQIDDAQRYLGAAPGPATGGGGA
ncbi:MAG: NAD-binding protein [Armatimonadota bacterium]